MSKATVEIERMVIRVENLFIESSSLEPTLLERIRMNLEKIPQMQNEEPEKIYSWWNDLGSDFIRLNQNYQDYMRELKSVKAEQMMKTQESHTAKTKRSRTSGSTGTVKFWKKNREKIRRSPKNCRTKKEIWLKKVFEIRLPQSHWL